MFFVLVAFRANVCNNPSMAKHTTKTKDGFTRLWGVRFNPEEAQVITEEAKAKSLAPGSYIRMAAMESARVHRRTRVG